jgi:hypothetical protein
MTETPEMVLARADGDTDALRRRGFAAEADRLAKLAEEFRVALAPLVLVTELTAVSRSGKSLRWLRERHATWVRTGAAGFDAVGNRLYRLCVLPTRLARDEGAALADQLLRAG